VRAAAGEFPMVFDYKKNRTWAENLTIVMQLGLTMVGCIGFCFYVGLKLDQWLGTRGIFVAVFTVLGVVGGANVAYRQIMETMKDKDRQDKPDSPQDGIS
jgi:ATP synthase protein I